MANEHEALEKAAAAYPRSPDLRAYRSAKLNRLLDAVDAYLKATEQPKSRWLDADPADCNDAPLANAKTATPAIDRESLETAIPAFKAFLLERWDRLGPKTQLVLAAAQAYLDLLPKPTKTVYEVRVNGVPWDTQHHTLDSAMTAARRYAGEGHVTIVEPIVVPA